MSFKGPASSGPQLESEPRTPKMPLNHVRDEARPGNAHTILKTPLCCARKFVRRQVRRQGQARRYVLLLTTPRIRKKIHKLPLHTRRPEVGYPRRTVCIQSGMTFGKAANNADASATRRDGTSIMPRLPSPQGTKKPPLRAVGKNSGSVLLSQLKVSQYHRRNES